MLLLESEPAQDEAVEVARERDRLRDENVRLRDMLRIVGDESPYREAVRQLLGDASARR